MPFASASPFLGIYTSDTFILAQNFAYSSVKYLLKALSLVEKC